MLEIIGQILCAMLLFKGVGFIVEAFGRQTDNAGHLIVSLAAAAFSIMAAIYFFNVIGDQASGARKAMEQATQNMHDSQRSLQQSIDQFERGTGVNVP